MRDKHPREVGWMETHRQTVAVLGVSLCTAQVLSQEAMGIAPLRIYKVSCKDMVTMATGHAQQIQHHLDTLPSLPWAAILPPSRVFFKSESREVFSQYITLFQRSHGCGGAENGIFKRCLCPDDSLMSHTKVTLGKR